MSKSLFLNGDALKLLSRLPDESVDLVITDPPYPSLEKHRAVGTTTRLQNWIPTTSFKYIAKVIKELYRVMTKNSHLYVFTNGEALFKMRSAGKKVGFKYWKFLTWNKMAIGMGYHYRNQCEYILFFEKGKRRLRDLGMSDYFEFKRLKGKQYYPTEKPVELCKLLIQQSSEPGDIVLDPFVGSGTTSFAAKAAGRRSIGIDVALPAVEHQQRKATSCNFSLKNKELRADFAAAYRMLTTASEEKHESSR